jgi:exosome complex exonuclease DIS3/RRP44
VQRQATAERMTQSSCFIATSVLEEAKHRSMKVYQRVRTLLAANKSCFVFSNEHHRSTYVERLAQESPNGALALAA